MRGKSYVNQHVIIFLCLCLLGGLSLTACNPRPEPPKPAWYKQPIKSVDVDPNAPAEVQAVETAETAKLKYQTSLEALAQYYATQGDEQRRYWAERELKNLREAQTFDWTGITPPSVTPPPANAKLGSKELIEDVLGNRRAYVQSLDHLAQYYEKNNDDFKAYAVHNIQIRFRPEETYMYLLKAELPPEDLEPCKVIPEANALYDEGLKLYYEGSAVPGVADYEKEREALQKFLTLVRRYPDSTKIAKAAFYIAEIYKEYFKEHYLAVKWYERALMWSPTIPLPVRYQCAVQYDFNLEDKEMALEMYKQAMEKESAFKDNLRYAKQRVGELQDIIAEQKAKGELIKR